MEQNSQIFPYVIVQFHFDCDASQTIDKDNVNFRFRNIYYLFGNINFAIKRTPSVVECSHLFYYFMRQYY